jgi:hypothetical protein
VIGEGTIADAILDRLVHGAHRISLKSHWGSIQNGGLLSPEYPVNQQVLSFVSESNTISQLLGILLVIGLINNALGVWINETDKASLYLDVLTDLKARMWLTTYTNSAHAHPIVDSPKEMTLVISSQSVLDIQYI